MQPPSCPPPAHLPPPPAHTSPPPTSNRPFFRSFFGLHLFLSVHCDIRGVFFFFCHRGRSGLHLSFASCYHFSHLYLLPTSAPLTPTLPRFAFDIHQLVNSRVSEERRGGAGAELTHDGELLTLQLREPSGYSIMDTQQAAVMLTRLRAPPPRLGQEDGQTGRGQRKTN